MKHYISLILLLQILVWKNKYLIWRVLEQNLIFEQKLAYCPSVYI